MHESPPEKQATDIELDPTFKFYQDFDVVAHFEKFDEHLIFLNEEQCLGTFSVKKTLFGKKNEDIEDKMRWCCEEIVNLHEPIRITGASGIELSERPDKHDYEIMIAGVPERCMDVVSKLDGGKKVGSTCGERCVRYGKLVEDEYKEIKHAILDGFDLPPNKAADDFWEVPPGSED